MAKVINRTGKTISFTAREGVPSYGTIANGQTVTINPRPGDDRISNIVFGNPWGDSHPDDMQTDDIEGPSSGAYELVLVRDVPPKATVTIGITIS